MADADDNPGGRFTTYVSTLPTESVPDPNQAYFSMSFSAHRARKFMPEPEVVNPYVDERSNATALDVIQYLPEGELTTVGGNQVLFRTERDPTAPVEGPASYGTTLYFLVESVVYHVWITYAPPVVPTDDNQASAWHTYNQIVNTIVYSFRVDKEAPYLTNQPQQVAPATIQAQIEAEMQLGPATPPPVSTPIQGYP